MITYLGESRSLRPAGAAERWRSRLHLESLGKAPTTTCRPRRNSWQKRDRDETRVRVSVESDSAGGGGSSEVHPIRLERRVACCTPSISFLSVPAECRERLFRRPGLCPVYDLVSALAPRRAAAATPIEPPSFRWGAQPQDWTTYQETAVRPLYEAVFNQLGLSGGTRLLDVGCGAGLAAQLAASRGARVWALDASAALLEIARSRVPEGEFRLGDMAALPYAEASFDVVTGFNSFQFTTGLAAVFGQVKRVIRPGGSVVVAVWGRPEECESAATVNAISTLVPDPRPGVRGPFALSAPGVVDVALTQAGLCPTASGAVACPYTYPDLSAAVAGWLASGTAARAIQHVGAEAVRQAIIDSLPPYRAQDGSYRQHNIFRYVIASP